MKRKKLNAEQRQLAAEWLVLKAKNSKPLERGAIAKAIKASAGAKVSKIPKLFIPTDRDPRGVSSVDSGKGDTALVERKHYTGDKVLGLSTLHKSNMVPIFNFEDARDIAKMRR